MATPIHTSEPPSFHRRRISSWSEWSDPRESTASSSRDGRGTIRTSAVSATAGVSLPLSNPAGATAGIRIPAFLQPLLGLDFVPYLPPQVIMEERDNGENDAYQASVEDEDLTDFDDLPDDAVIAETLAWSIHSATSVDRALDLTVALEQPVSSDFSLDITPKRKGKFSLAKALKGKRRSSEGHQQQRKTPSPRSSADMDMHWMRKQHATLLAHQQHLEAVETESKVVQQQAAEIETRVAEVRQQALQLQQALELSMQKLQFETQSLESSRAALHSLKDQAVRAAEQMGESVAAIRKGRRTTTATNNSGSGDRRSRRQHMFSSLRKPRIRSSTEEHVSDSRAPMALTTPTAASLRLELPETPASPLRARANTEPVRSFRSTSSSSFMRVSDLELPSSREGSRDELDSSSSVSSSNQSRHSPAARKDSSGEDFFFIDQDVGLVLNRLFQLGYNVVTDESDRFSPTRDTQAHFSKYPPTKSAKDWPFHPWFTPQGNDVLTWTGGVPHKGFGHDWPVVKARGIVQTSPRLLLDFLLDSSKIKTYNRMSQGRFDLLEIQSGVETTAQESEYGFAGKAKIMRSLNKPRMLPKTIEMLSLWYTRALEHTPDAFMIVSRSVWERENTSTPNKASHLLRSEMLLGVQLLRPCQGGTACEFTTITHVYSPGVPELLAKRMAPGSASSLIRDIQEIFHSTKK